MTPRRIVIYGGSFNPFAKHHQDIIRFLIEKERFNVVLVVPAAAHALKDDLPEYMHRVNMTKLGINDLVFNGMPSLPFEARVQVSTLEMDMLQTQAPPVRTYPLLQQFRKAYPEDEIKFAIGPDILDELDQWANVEEIKSEFGFVEVPVQSMRATKLRGMMGQGVDSWKRYVPTMVARYITLHGLYDTKAQETQQSA